MIFFISDLHKSIISDSFLGTNISNEKKALLNQVMRMIKSWSKYDKFEILNSSTFKKSPLISFDKRVSICLISSRSTYEINQLLRNYSR
jgi:hypothetical protein